MPIQAVVAKYLESFKEFAPRTKPASFTVGDVIHQSGGHAAPVLKEWIVYC